MRNKLHALLWINFLPGACAVTTPEPTSTPAPTPTPTPAPRDRAGWNIVWYAEVDGAELDRTSWTFDIGGNGWGNVS